MELLYMNNKKVDKIRSIVADILEVPLENITNDTFFGDIKNWNSMNHIKLILAVEEEFDVRFDDKKLSELSSISEILNYLNKR